MSAKESTKSRSRSAPAQPNAVQLLKDDHAEVKQLFDRFEKLADDASRAEREEIVREACAKLTVHATVEEEIFYPAARETPDVEDLLNEAEVEHGTAKDLIAKLDAMESDDEMFDANFTVLSEYIKHHVKEEEGELFPKIAKSDLDLVGLGAEILTRKQELTGQLATA